MLMPLICFSRAMAIYAIRYAYDIASERAMRPYERGARRRYAI